MKKSRDCFYVLLGAAFYGIMPVIIKNSYNYGANGFNVTFYMALLSIPIYLLILAKRHVSLKQPWKKVRDCIIVGLADAGTYLFLYLSYAYIPVGVASMLNFIYPITVALAVHFLFKEKFGFIKIGALVVYLGGMVFLYGGDISGQPLGFVLALASGLIYTVHAVYLDKSGLAAEDVYVVGFYKAVTVAAATGIAGAAMNVPMMITGWQAWGSIFIAMILCRIGSTALIMLGIRGLGAFLPCVLSTLEPIVALLSGWLILRETVTGVQLIGVVMVLAAVLLIVFSDSREQRKKEQEAA